MAAAARAPSKFRHKLKPWQRAEIRAIAKLERGGRPLYTLGYIAALYGITIPSVAQLCKRRAGRLPWHTVRGI